MSNELTTSVQPKVPSVAIQFRKNIELAAMSLLREWVGDDKAKEATGRIAVALSQAAATSRNPDEIYQCTPASVGAVVAVAALTNIMVGTGPTALAYALPRRPRKGAQPQLTYNLSHRGLNVLASRADMTMIPVPVGFKDDIDMGVDGDAKIRQMDMDNPPQTEEDLRGVVVVIRRISTGITVFRGWVSKSIINARRERSSAYNYAEDNQGAQSTDPWHANYVEMAMKTAMHYAIARGWCVIDDTDASTFISRAYESEFSTMQIEAAPRTSVQAIRQPATLETIAAANTVAPAQEPEVVDVAPVHVEPGEAQAGEVVDGASNNSRMMVEAKDMIRRADTAKEVRDLTKHYMIQFQGDKAEKFALNEELTVVMNERLQALKNVV